MKLVDYDSYIINIYPPYDIGQLIFHNIIYIRCPRCQKVYTRNEFGIKNGHDSISCHTCKYTNKIYLWPCLLALRN